MNPQQPAISVIVPVYNAEATLRRCVDSIMAQSFTDWELILVNDGSKDGSGAICDDYAAKDPRVRVIHKPNEGVAATRRRGIEEARGVFSIQVDSDDWVKPSMLEELYAVATSEDADMVVCDFYQDYDGRKPLKKVSQQPAELTAEQVLKNIAEGRGVKPYCWNKFVRHECYKRYNVTIPSDVSHGEDFLICLALLRHGSIKVAYHPKAYYHYMQGEGCNLLTRTYTAEDFERDSRLRDHSLALMEGHKLRPQVDERISFHIVRRAFNGGVFSSAEFKKLNYKYRNSIRKNHHIAWHRRWRLYLACIGLYRLMYGYKAVAGLAKKR